MGIKGPIPDIPNVKKRPAKIPIIGEPFLLAPIVRDVFKSNPKLKIAIRSVTREHAEQLLAQSSQARGKYMFTLLYLGKEIQKSLRRLETERVLNTSKFKSYVNLSMHPSFKIYEDEVDQSKGMSDRGVLAWSSVLRDILAVLQAHIIAVSLDIEMTKLPYLAPPTLERDP